MKTNNPPKKLRLLKKTIAHLNHEQMLSAHGGDLLTRLFCSKYTDGCQTNDCGNSVTIGCPQTQVC